MHHMNIEMRNDAKCCVVFDKIFDSHNIDERAELKMDLNLATKNINKNFVVYLDSPKKL